MDSATQLFLEDLQKAYSYISGLLPSDLKRLEVGIICGSGMSGLASVFEASLSIPYSHIPGFPRSTVLGHQNALKIGKLNGINCIMFLGRFHQYEGHGMQQITLPVRLLAKLGVANLIITNASGTMDAEAFNVGDFIAVNGHISFPTLSGSNPLVGTNLAEFGPRHVNLQNSYHKDSHKMLLEAAEKAGVPTNIIKTGVYGHISGPAFETDAEVKLLKMIGVACAGMSTVPEVIVASHCKAIRNTVVISLVTDDPLKSNVTHDSVLAVATARANVLNALVAELIPIINRH